MFKKKGYYYRSKRVNGKVKTEYLGSGALAELSLLIDQEEREKQQAQREELRRELAELQQDDREAAFLCDLINQIAAAALLVEGCHTHNRQWRRKR